MNQVQDGGAAASKQTAGTPAKAKAKRRKSTLREYAEAIVIAVLLTLVIRTFVFQAFRIPTGSMEDTLLVGDFLFVNKFLYGAKVPFTDLRLPAIREPKHGDIMVFKFPKDPKRDFIKRLVGVPGDTVEIRDKVLFINGEEQPSDYVKHTSSRTRGRSYQNPNIYPPKAGNRDNYGPVVVPDDHYFMMGDNRDNSDDSRFWGFLNRDLIKGKAVFIYWSKNENWYRVRLDRVGDLIK